MTASSVDPLAKSFLQGRSGSLDDALISLCDHVEALASGSIAGLTICNPSRTHIERAVFPRLPNSPPRLGQSHYRRLTLAAACRLSRTARSSPVTTLQKRSVSIHSGSACASITASARCNRDRSISASADRMPRSCLPTCNRAWKPTGMSH